MTEIGCFLFGILCAIGPAFYLIWEAHIAYTKAAEETRRATAMWERVNERVQRGERVYKANAALIDHLQNPLIIDDNS